MDHVEAIWSFSSKLQKSFGVHLRMCNGIATLGKDGIGIDVCFGLAFAASLPALSPISSLRFFGFFRHFRYVFFNPFTIIIHEWAHVIFGLLTGSVRSRRNQGRPESATFWVNASRVLPPLTISNVKNPSICILFFKTKNKLFFLKKKKKKKCKKKHKKKEKTKKNRKKKRNRNREKNEEKHD